MKQLWKLVITVFLLTTFMTSTAFAAGWTTGQGENHTRWWYDLGNEQYYGTSSMSVEWQWLDGNSDGTAECYAFDSQGWMYANVITPDGYFVNADGAWTVEGVVQTKSVTPGYAGTRSQAQKPDENSIKILIAYFSKSGTTEAAAKEIQSVIGGDLFEITVVDTYPSSYQSTVDRARRELDQNVRPVLDSYVEDMKAYDIILLGYPIWLAYHNLIQCTQA